MLLVFSTLGCAGTSWMKAPDLSKLKPPGPPAKALAVWEPAIRHDGDNTPQRGFGGRVYFYDQESRNPIKVKGNVVVYAFDEENRKPDDNAPTRSYYFAKNDVKKLYSKSKLGHSYNFWVPWDAEGPDGKVKKVSLIVRYVPDTGSSVVSSQAAVYLPGKEGQTEMMAKTEWDDIQNFNGPIQQVAHLTEARRNSLDKTDIRLIESNESRPSAMQTSTISVPTNAAQGLQAALSIPAVKPNAEPNPVPVAQREVLPAGFVNENKKK